MIKYPHPNGVPGFALAEVVIETRQARRARCRHSIGQKTALQVVLLMSKFEGKKQEQAFEHRAFDIPKGDLDRAIGQLNENGFFTVAKVTQPGVDVSCQVDRQEEHKIWRQVPELDAIMLHVRKSGQLVNYRRDPKLEHARTHR